MLLILSSVDLARASTLICMVHTPQVSKEINDMQNLYEDKVCLADCESILINFGTKATYL